MGVQGERASGCALVVQGERDGCAPGVHGERDACARGVQGERGEADFSPGPQGARGCLSIHRDGRASGRA